MTRMLARAIVLLLTATATPAAADELTGSGEWRPWRHAFFIKTRRSPRTRSRGSPATWSELRLDRPPDRRHYGSDGRGTARDARSAIYVVTSCLSSRGAAV